MIASPMPCGRHRLGDDLVHAQLVELAQGVEQPHPGLDQLALAGAENMDALPIGEIGVAVIRIATVAEQRVGLARLLA